MSTGSILLKLQQIDLALERDRAQLSSMPEIAELAKKRRAYQKLKADATKLFAQRKDLETYLAELDQDESDCHEDIAIAQRKADTSDYREVQQLEVELSALAKKLEKIAFDRAGYEKQLSELSTKQTYLEGYIAKFEASIVADTKTAREKAADIQARIDGQTQMRTSLVSRLSDDIVQRYESALKRFRGLAVERLDGTVPSVCRTSLQESSMSELSRRNGLCECPYCHRILVLDTDEEA